MQRTCNNNSFLTGPNGVKSPNLKNTAIGYVTDQHYFVRKCSESPRKVEIEKVRMEMRGNTAKYTVKRIILP